MSSPATTRHARPVDALLAGLRLAIGTGNRTEDRATLSRVGDWRAVADLVIHHGVGALFLQAIRSNGVRVTDAEVERGLAARRRRNATRGLRQLAGLQQAAADLTSRGVPVLILKGLPLSQQLYGNPFVKSSTDIDLLVPPDAFTAAGRILGDRGWRPLMPVFRETPARKRWCDWLRDEHAFGGPGGKLELHRNLLKNPFLFEPSFTDLDARGETIEIAGCPYRTLGNADQLLYLACHGSLHYWERLKWLCDFAMLVRSMDDSAVERAVARGLTLGLAGAVMPSLLLCRRALHVNTPPAATAALRKKTLRIRFAARFSQRTWTPRSGPRHVLRKAAMRAGRVFVGRGARYCQHEIRRMLIRPHDFSQIDLPDCLFWLYVPLRPVLRILRALRGNP